MGRFAMFLRCCAALLWAIAAAPAVAASLLLDARTAQADAWPVVRMLADASGQATVQEMLARRDEFAPPVGPRANHGLRPEAVWLLVPLRTDVQAPRRWVMSVDYASIDRIDLFLPSSQGPGEPVRLGRELPFAEHPLPSAVHAATIELEPGREHELLLRVASRSTMALPITISAPDAFHAREARRQFLQGLMAGAMLCLLLYSLTQWASLRDAMFLHYSATIAGTAVFFVAYSGLGPQHLWGDNAWLSQHAAPLSVLVAIVGGSLFIERVLDVGALRPWLSRGLKLLAAAAGATALCYALGLVDYRVAQRLATFFGPLPMIMAVPVAWTRARRGERVGLYMLAGWGAYGLSTLTMAALLRGWIDVTPWSEHAFQAGAMIEMAMWMRVLGVRVEELRTSAQRAHLERDALRSLALTDALTGLPNRRGLSDVLAGSLSTCTPDCMTAVYLIDLDGFKPINDSLGHEAGDEVLVGVARRLQSLLRARDTVARLGGDEFVVVASGLAGDADAQALGRKLLEGFREPFTAAGRPCAVGLTVGYALAPLDGQDADALLKRADAAMYAGKQAGRHCLRRGQASVGLAGGVMPGRDEETRRMLLNRMSHRGAASDGGEEAMTAMTKRTNRCRGPVATLLLAAAATAQANQLADLPLEELMRIEVVSAARKSQRLADVPASMHVISADDIRSSGARNLPEALRLAPGMDVAQLSGSRWAVSTRGFTGRYANKLLVLVDGRSVYSPMFSGVLWEAERVPLDTIERIEVMHGPAGSVWGSNAVNGVINIITKAAAETQGSFFDASVGDDGQRSLRLRHGARAGEGSAWRLGAQADRGDSGRGADGSDANDSYRQAMADLRWDRSWSPDSRSTLEAQVMRSRSNEIQLEGSYLPPYQTLLPTRLDVDRVTLAARHEERFSDRLSASLALSLVDERIRFGDRVRASPRTLDASVSAVHRMDDRHELIFGGGLRHVDLPAERTEWIAFSPAERRGIEWSTFIQDEWTIVPGRWRLNAGVRLDHDLYSGTHPQPNLRLLFTPDEEVALWAGLSRANRSPARGEQDGIIRLFVLPPGSPGNPGPLPIQLLGGNGQSGHVDAERNLDAVEFGLRAQASASLSFDAAAFWHRLRDDIGSGVPAGAPVFVPTPQPHLEIANQSRPYTVRLHGVEASADWRPAAGWRHQAGLAYLGVRGPADAATTGLDRQLFATPRWQAQWRSVVDLAPAWRLDARLRYVGERGAPYEATQRVDDYTALDATLTWRAGASAEIAIGGTNLLRPAVVEFAPDFGLASATLVPRRVFVRWRQSF